MAMRSLRVFPFWDTLRLSKRQDLLTPFDLRGVLLVGGGKRVHCALGHELCDSRASADPRQLMGFKFNGFLAQIRLQNWRSCRSEGPRGNY